MTEYFSTIDQRSPEDYLSALRATGWLDGWSQARQAALELLVSSHLGRRPLKSPFDVFRHLAVCELDVTRDRAGEHRVYLDRLDELSQASFGQFQPMDAEQSEVARQKVRSGVFSSRLATGQRVAAVSFCLKDHCYGAVFRSRKLDPEFLDFVNAAIRHSADQREFICLPTEPRPPANHRARVAQARRFFGVWPDMGQTSVAFVTRDAVRRALDAGLLPETKWPDALDLPAASIVPA